EFLDEAFRELKGADGGAISRLQARFDDSVRLKDDVTARDAEIREMRTIIEDTRGKLQSLEVSAKRDESRLKSQIDELTTENVRQRADLTTKKEELTSLNAKLNPKEASKATAASDKQFWWWVGGSALVAIAVVAGVWWIGSRSEAPLPTEEPLPKTLQPSEQ